MIRRIVRCISNRISYYYIIARAHHKPNQTKPILHPLQSKTNNKLPCTTRTTEHVNLQ